MSIQAYGFTGKVTEQQKHSEFLFFFSETWEDERTAADSQLRTTALDRGDATLLHLLHLTTSS